jgi:hypothetical protein
MSGHRERPAQGCESAHCQHKPAAAPACFLLWTAHRLTVVNVPPVLQRGVHGGGDGCDAAPQRCALRLLGLELAGLKPVQQAGVVGGAGGVAADEGVAVLGQAVHGHDLQGRGHHGGIRNGLAASNDAAGTAVMESLGVAACIPCTPGSFAAQPHRVPAR